MKSAFPQSVFWSHRTRLLRFAILGGASTALYIAIVWLGTTALHIRPLLMNVIGYLAVLPVNFVLHRSLTFVSHGAVAVQIRRFLIVHGFNLTTSSLFYVISDLLDAPLLAPIIAVCVVVPACQFLALDVWVFQRDHDTTPPVGLQDR
jgi:putative flippase GtrA